MSSTGQVHDLNDGMKMQQIMNTIHNLSKSQGFYGRLERDILDLKKNDRASYNQLRKEWESKKYKDAVDFIIDLEG